MQYIFAYIQLALVSGQLLLLRRRRQGRTMLCLVFTMLISIPSFIPTTSANNIRVDLVLTDFVLTPVAAVCTIMIWIVQRRAERKPEAP
jgi:surface polysaccharide O-acyltransferase-like enzyme